MKLNVKYTYINRYNVSYNNTKNIQIQETQFFTLKFNLYKSMYCMYLFKEYPEALEDKYKFHF